jgi:hypothetical protein
MGIGIDLYGGGGSGTPILAIAKKYGAAMDVFEEFQLFRSWSGSVLNAYGAYTEDDVTPGLIPLSGGLFLGSSPVVVTNLMVVLSPSQKTSLILGGPVPLMFDHKAQPHLLERLPGTERQTRFSPLVPMLRFLRWAFYRCHKKAYRDGTIKFLGLVPILP